MARIPRRELPSREAGARGRMTVRKARPGRAQAASSAMGGRGGLGRHQLMIRYFGGSTCKTLASRIGPGPAAATGKYVTRSRTVVSPPGPPGWPEGLMAQPARVLLSLTAVSAVFQSL